MRFTTFFTLNVAKKTGVLFHPIICHRSISTNLHIQIQTLNSLLTVRLMYIIGSGLRPIELKRFEFLNRNQISWISGCEFLEYIRFDQCVDRHKCVRNFYFTNRLYILCSWISPVVIIYSYFIAHSTQREKLTLKLTPNRWKRKLLISKILGNAKVSRKYVVYSWN